MKALTRTLALLGLSAAIGGCVVYREPPRRHVVVYREAPAPPPPAPAVETDVVWEDEEVHTVVYREYFGATEEEIVLIPHYRRYYGYSDDDIYFLWFVSCHAHVSFEICCNRYYSECGGDYNRLVVLYNVPRSSFFVAVGPGMAYPPVYARTYACYHSNSYTVAFSHEEYHALVSMKVGCEYQGHPPATFVAKVQAGTPPGRVVIQSRDRCGAGGRSVTGAAVQKTAPRPWTMPPAQRQAWQNDHQARVTRNESSFQASHAEQVQRTKERESARRDQKSATPGTGADHGKTDGKPQTHGAPGQAPGSRPSSPGAAEQGQHPPGHPAPPPSQKPEGPPVKKGPPPKEEKPRGGDEKKER
jgi:hypothetical protein